MYIWKIRYTGYYSASSGMEKYTNEYPNLEGYIITEKDSIANIIDEYKKTHGIGADITIIEAKFIGVPINDNRINLIKH